MSPQVATTRRKPIEYDALQRRLWIFGQRCHHGATGVVVTLAACVGVAAEPKAVPAGLAMAATGAVMMAHDWKDHAIWFERGYGSQPARLERAHAASYTPVSAS